jgi:heptosyltransferase-2
VTDSLVVQTSFLGDMVLTTPLFAFLARSGPVDVVCTPAAAALVANNPSIREVISYDKRGTESGARGFARLASRLRDRGYGAAYLAQGSVRSGALALAAGVADRVGFASSAGKVFYTTRIPPIENMHHAARLLSLGTRDPLREPSRGELRPHLYPGDRERAAVDQLLNEARGRHPEWSEGSMSPGALNSHEGERSFVADAPQDDKVPLIAVAPGSVWATKRWPYYPELSKALVEIANVVVVGGDADRSLAAEISAATDGRAIDATGRLSLLASAELIGRAALLITNDSAPQHLASAMNTPTLAVFGPTVPEFGFGPLAERSRVLGHTGLACRPCDRHGPQRCPLGHWRCMREISAADVAAAARALLS